MPVHYHRNICVILGVLAEKLPGPSSVAMLTSSTLEYLIMNLVRSTIKSHCILSMKLNKRLSLIQYIELKHDFLLSKNIILQDYKKIDPIVTLFSLIALEKFAQISKY